jgi:hypothetical protein
MLIFQDYILGIISIVGCAISLLAMAATVVLHVVLWRWVHIDFFGAICGLIWAASPSKFCQSFPKMNTYFPNFKVYKPCLNR